MREHGAGQQEERLLVLGQRVARELGHAVDATGHRVEDAAPGHLDKEHGLHARSGSAGGRHQPVLAGGDRHELPVAVHALSIAWRYSCGTHAFRWQHRHSRHVVLGTDGVECNGCPGPSSMAPHPLGGDQWPSSAWSRYTNRRSSTRSSGPTGRNWRARVCPSCSRDNCYASGPGCQRLPLSYVQGPVFRPLFGRFTPSDSGGVRRTSPEVSCAPAGPPEHQANVGCVC